MAEDRNIVNLLIGRFANLDAAVAARVILFMSSFLVEKTEVDCQLDELRKQLCHKGDVTIKRMNRHRQELNSLRDAPFRLEERVKMLEEEKAILEAKGDSMSERLCRCSESIPRIKGQGSAAAPFELEDEEELEYATPPTSRPGSSSTSMPGKWQFLSS